MRRTPPPGSRRDLLAYPQPGHSPPAPAKTCAPIPKRDTALRAVLAVISARSSGHCEVMTPVCRYNLRHPRQPHPRPPRLRRHRGVERLRRLPALPVGAVQHRGAPASAAGVPRRPTPPARIHTPLLATGALGVPRRRIDHCRHRHRDQPAPNGHSDGANTYPRAASTHAEKVSADSRDR